MAPDSHLTCQADARYRSHDKAADDVDRHDRGQSAVCGFRSSRALSVRQLSTKRCRANGGLRVDLADSPGEVEVGIPAFSTGAKFEFPPS